MVKKYLVFSMICLFALSGIAMAAGKNSSKNGNCPVVQQPAAHQTTSRGAVAKNMQQQGGRGAVAKNGIGPISQLGPECVSVTVNGTVAAIESQPCTMVISTLDGDVTVYGIGSDSCWEANNMSKPVVTDEVTIECCQITFPDGSVKLRATSVTTDEGTIELIDADGKILCTPPIPPARRQNHSGNGPVSQLVSKCVPVIVNGIVAAIDSQPCTIVVSTIDGDVTVYGIGPDSCWEANNMSKPVVTDEVTIECCQITFPDGSVKLRATSVTTPDGTIELIDADGKRLCTPPTPPLESKNRFGNRAGR